MRVLSWDVGLRTLSYCLIEATVGDDKSKDKSFNIIQWDSIDVHVDGSSSEQAETATASTGSGVGRAAKRVKTSAVSIEQGARLIMDALHRRQDTFLNSVDAIIIEQQPAGGHNQHSNVRMKVMSHAIHCYFYTRNISAQPPRNTPLITFVPASSKFEEKQKEKKTKVSKTDANDANATQTQEPPEALTSAEIHTRYNKNKKFAVEKTGELLREALAETDSSRLFFESTSTKKKDDLADSFLLGYYFLMKQRTQNGAVAVAAPTRKRKTAPRILE